MSVSPNPLLGTRLGSVWGRNIGYSEQSPQKHADLSFHSPFSPNLLITLWLGRRPSRENPAGSLRILDLKGPLRSSACPLLLTQEEIQPSGRQSPDGTAFLPLTKLLVQNQKMNHALPQPILNLVSYLMIWRYKGPHLLYFYWLLPKTPQVFYLDSLKNIWDPIILLSDRYMGICSDDSKIIAYLAKWSAGVSPYSLEILLPKTCCQKLSSQISNLNLEWKIFLKNL